MSGRNSPMLARNCPFWHVLGAQGELFRAHTHARPSMAKYFAHSTQRHGEIETDDTTARPQQGTAETGIASAPTNCTTNAHFSPAKATAVSIPHRHQRAKAIAVSDHRATWPTGPGCGARGRQRHHRQPNVARNLSWSFFETPQECCNCNDLISEFERGVGELRAKLGVLQEWGR